MEWFLDPSSKLEKYYRNIQQWNNYLITNYSIFYGGFLSYGATPKSSI